MPRHGQHRPAAGGARGERFGGRGQFLQRRGDRGRGLLGAPAVRAHVGVAERQAQHPRKAAQGGVLAERREQGLDLGQAVAERFQLVQLEIEQAVAPEEGIALRIEDVAKQAWAGADLGGQARRGVLGQVRRRRLDDHGQVVGELREGLAQRPVVTPERQLLGQHVRGVGVDPDPGDREVGGAQGSQKRHDEHRQGRTANPTDPADQEPVAGARVGSGIHGRGGRVVQDLASNDSPGLYRIWLIRTHFVGATGLPGQARSFRWCAGKKPQDPDLAAWGMVSRPGMSHWPEALRQALPG